jgi:flagellar basal-body rod protein FlgF
MGNALTITEASMINGMRHLDIIGNNLANADTAGYKREVAVTRPFNSYLVEAGEQSRMDLSGITSQTDFTIGVPRHTGNPLDLAIEGDGYFVVESPQGTLYTRQGVFRLDASGYLVTADGHRVVGDDGGGVRLTSDQPRIDKEGVIWEAGEQVGNLKLARFVDSRDLEKLGGGMYRIGGARALSETLPRPGVRQGFVETSNVSAMTEMVDLIGTMRQLEGGQKVIQGYSEMLDLAIQTIAEV